jgi:hypothetical protein
MSPPNRQPAIQVDVDMSPPPRTPVPTGANTHIIDLDASPPRRPYSSHTGDLPDVHVIDPFLSPPPRARSSQSIRLEVSPPSRHSNLPTTLVQDTNIDLDTSPPRRTPLRLPGALRERISWHCGCASAHLSHSLGDDPHRRIDTYTAKHV